MTAAGYGRGGGTSGTSTRGEIEADLKRLAERLRGSHARTVHASAADVRHTLQELADTAQGIDERAAVEPPKRRIVPELPDAALGDQLDVIGADLLLAARGADDAEQVWSGSDRARLGDELARVARTLHDLRRSL